MKWSLNAWWAGFSRRLHLPAYERAVVGLLLASNAHHARRNLPGSNRSLLSLCVASELNCGAGLAGDGPGEGARRSALEGVERDGSTAAESGDEVPPVVAEVDLRGLEFSQRVRSSKGSNFLSDFSRPSVRSHLEKSPFDVSL